MMLTMTVLALVVGIALVVVGYFTGYRTGYTDAQEDAHRLSDAMDAEGHASPVQASGLGLGAMEGIQYGRDYEPMLGHSVDPSQM